MVLFYILLALLLINFSFPYEIEEVEVGETGEVVGALIIQEHASVDGVVDLVESIEENLTQPVDRSNEEWVKYAVLDVAYYLRAHKFSDFDRRYYKQANEDNFQYQHFPDPPLRYLHWEVNKFCENNFYDCLAYLQNTVLRAELVRSIDTNVIMNEKHWEYFRNLKSIEKVDKECNRLKAIDWRDADPFKGPLERFQWRVSASYYMCYYSMLDISPLILFDERCDNFAGCLVGKTPFNNDPCGDDSKPYQCAMYSFCPDVCCPLKQIQDIEECLDSQENPCYWQEDRNNRVCSFNRENNRDFTAIVLNQWNVTCKCDAGYVWESIFGMCVDIDECSTGTHTCVPVVQICLNLQGQYSCACAWGYINVSGSCIPNQVLTDTLETLHQHYHPPTAQPPRPFSLFRYLFKWTIGLFYTNRIELSTDLPILKTNENDEDIVFNS